ILGKVTDAWLSGDALMGRIKFNQTEQGQKAEGMVARGEASAVSVGYRVDKWEITDDDGNVIDPKRDRIAWDRDHLIFTATEWQLFEVSLVGVPADGAAMVRALPVRDPVLAAIRTRMRMRQRMTEAGLALGYG